MAITDASGDKSWKFGKPLSIKSLPDFVANLRHHEHFPAMCIAAHLTGSRGVHEETKLAILDNLEAEIARTKGHLKYLEDSEKAPVLEYLHLLEAKQADRQGIHLGVLDHIGACGFDGLQVKGKDDEKHYRFLHRFREEHGRAVPLIASDAHCIPNILCADKLSIPFLKLKPFNSRKTDADIFSAVRDSALKFGETRLAFGSTESVATWIEGIEIRFSSDSENQFWCSKRSESKQVIIPFSRNLNCLIGGRGSGKSSLLEAISFVAGQSHDFDTKANHAQDFYRRASATLSGATVRICWKTLSAAGGTLKKRALFATRHFDGDNRHSQTEFYDIENSELLPSELPVVNIEYFRTHDIEKHAEAEKLRHLLDNLCGAGLTTLNDQIAELKQQLAAQRRTIVNLCKRICELTSEGGALREYLIRKQKYEKLNSNEVRKRYDSLDHASFAARTMDKVVENWNNVESSFDAAAIRRTIEVFYEDTRQRTLNKEGQLLPGLDSLTELLNLPASNSVPDVQLLKKIVDASNNLEQAIRELSKSLNEAKNSVHNVVKTEKEELINNGLPEGGEERQSKKEAFEEAQADLDEYESTLATYLALLVDRQNTSLQFRNKCAERTRMRHETAEQVTAALAKDLDQTVLKIEAKARDMADKTEFWSWLQDNFAAGFTQHRETRLTCLLEENNLQPEELQEILLARDTPIPDRLIVNKQKVSDGRITQGEAVAAIEACRAVRLAPLHNFEAFKKEDIPREVQNGMLIFPMRGDKLLIDAVLSLQEVEISDMPVVLLNDRPLEPGSVLRPLEELSPGQRCSALLPILLLTGTAPLIIDQPEDNLDNRLIRQVIVNVLSTIKLRRQVIIATHNPNLPVLGDAEETIVLAATDDRRGELRSRGDLDDYNVVKDITEIMEGGREAFQYRQSVYQTHWNREFTAK